MASAGGGLARGLQFGMQFRQQKQENRQRQEQARAEQLQQMAESASKTVDDLTAQAQQVLENADASGIPRNDPRVQKAIGTLQQEAVQLSKMASQLPGASVSPDLVQTQFQALTMQPTPEQSAQTEGRQEVAKAQAITGQDELDQGQRAQLAGVASDTQFQSKTALNPETGEVMRAAFDPTQGKTVTEGGEELPEGFITISGQMTGTPEELSHLGDTEQRDLRSREIATRNFIDTSLDTIELIRQNPDINTFTAKASAFIDDMQAEAKALGRNVMGAEFDEGILDPSNYEETFDELGVGNRRLQAMMVSLAFQAASASGQEGRSVSDRDIQRFMRQIGADASNPDALVSVLSDTTRRVARDFQTDFEVRAQRPFTGNLNIDQLPGPETGQPPPQPAPELPAAAEEMGVTPDVWNEMTDEEKALFR